MMHIEFMPLDDYVIGTSPECVILPASSVGWTQGSDSDQRQTVSFPLRTMIDFGAIAQVVSRERLLRLADYAPADLI